MSYDLFSIGHSTHALDRFLQLLMQHRMEQLVDVRRFPGSRKFPHFNRENLALALPEAGIAYHWLEVLGGRRHEKNGDPARNLGLRNASFRHYANYMATPEFHAGITQFLDLAGQKRTALMCSEGLFWRCHRRLVSDFLLSNGILVRHIMPAGELRSHTLTSGALIVDGEPTYPLATTAEE